MSSNTPRTSRVRSASKAVYMSWTIDSNGFNHESFGLKPGCFESHLLSSRYSKRDLKISFLNIFLNAGNSKTGLQLLLICIFACVNRTYIYLFQMSGKVLQLRQLWEISERGLTRAVLYIIRTMCFWNVKSIFKQWFWKISERGLTRAELHIFIWIDISLGRCAFGMLRVFSNNSDDSLELVLYDLISEITLLLANVVHCKANKLLKRLAFCLKSVI